MPARTTFRRLLILVALLVPIAASAQTDSLVEEALANMGEVDLDAWSYKVTTTREGKKTIERHDATKPETARWQLLMKNGESPTADELAEYAAAKNGQREQKKRRRKADGENDIEQLIEPGSVTLLAENSTRATYSFKMKADDDEGREFAEHVQATLVIHKKIPYVERLEMQSTEEIKPAIGVKIAEFHMSMRFSHDSDSGTILPSTIATRIKGRAFLVKSIDEDISVVFSDYKGPVGAITSDR